jgi:fluoride exporter
MTYLGVALAGAVGAVVRFLVDRAVQRRLDAVFPVGTMVVNVSGAFLAGVIGGLFLYRGLAMTPAVVIGIGFLGAYTTLSTFDLETLRLFESGSVVLGLANVVTSVVGGLAAAAAGVALGAAL